MLKLRCFLVAGAVLASACGAGRPAATPAPTLPPTPGPPKGGEVAIALPPTTPNNRPNANAGRTNGDLPATDLVPIADGCTPARPAAPSAGALFKYAHAHGVSLIGTDCYRPVDRQAAARTSACTGGNCACAGPPGHSMHGWGKAIDFEDAKGSIVSTANASYLWLKAHAHRFGWNHPQWAETGPCPEAWHWEWVGDGGVKRASRVRADVTAVVRNGDEGYALCTSLAQVIAKGPDQTIASSPRRDVNRLVVAAASTKQGLWTVDGVGDVRAYGEAKALSQAGGNLDPDVVGIAATTTGNGYWLVTKGGRVLAFGDAKDYGSAKSPTAPVVGIAASDHGYWIALQNGQVQSFGAAAPPTPIPAGPVIVAIAASQKAGYWLVADDGRIFTGAGAPFLGSLTSIPRQPIVSITGTKSGYGYWLTTVGGGVFAFGDAQFHGPA